MFSGMSKQFFSVDAKKSIRKTEAVHFIPNIIKGGDRLVIPVSMGRYDGSTSKIAAYDAQLNALFNCTAFLLKAQTISGVDVISTADLQLINWDKEKTSKIEQHFFDTHKMILAEQTKIYRWDEWIDEQGRKKFDEYSDIVDRMSTEDTEWYQLMVQTHNMVKMSFSLDKSLKYQRKEYAAVMLMSGYDHLIYTGPISRAWAYMYHILPQSTYNLPKFIQARVENHDHELMLTPDLSNALEKIILSNIQEIMTNATISKAAKESFVGKCFNILYQNEFASTGRRPKKL
jgi:hypothetical protein